MTVSAGYINGLNNFIAAFSDIPKTTLEKLRQVNKIAKEGNASTFTAVSSLDTIMNAFKYGRDAANDTFTLTREAQRKLKDYDEAFLDMIKLQIKFEIELAESKCEQCFQILGNPPTLVPMYNLCNITYNTVSINKYCNASFYAVIKMKVTCNYL